MNKQKKRGKSKHFFFSTYLVTLNIRNKRSARKTEKPNEPPLNSDHITSNIEPIMTIQSKRLNADEKYSFKPSAYIFINISQLNKPRKTNSAISNQIERMYMILKSIQM
mgnify:CR=1 FL=1